MRKGRWKLHVRKWNVERVRLYDLEADIGERNDVVEEYPVVVAELLALVEAAKDELGADASDTPGSDVRPVGQVTAPVTLPSYDPGTPYFMAEYDLTERG